MRIDRNRLRKFGNMRDHFIKLFDYDRYVNQRMMRMITDAGNPERPVQIMAHLLGAEQVWLTRCKGEPAIAGAIWPNWQSDVFEQTINDNHAGWISFLKTLAPDEFDRQISYKDSKGNSHQNKLSDVLIQITNHGVHHRAQMGQLLKQTGTELPFTDYIFYIRQFGN